MEIHSSTGSTEPVIQELQHYWDIDQMAAFLGNSRDELRDRAERGLVPAHRLRHGKKYYWKFSPSELLELKCDQPKEPGASIQ
ncbi:MAG TPA: hypothetical protein VMT53_21060 [Terriglobales bacterium]|nr:hypothetical protein [Terriglobales bacterium]